MKLKLYGFIVILLLIFLQITHPEAYAMEKNKHILLLGASVGKAWIFEGLPQRMNLKGYLFEYVGEYQFDKTKVLKEILARKDQKPAAVLVKECAAYFPGDQTLYQKLMIGWVKDCRASGVIPIPTTVVPVIKDNSFVTKIKDIIKRIIGRSPHDLRLTSILKFNDWIKTYAQKEGLAVFDLEAPLRISPEDRSLRLDLHSGDGLHLNAKAYGILDKAMLEFIHQNPINR